MHKELCPEASVQPGSRKPGTISTSQRRNGQTLAWGAPLAQFSPLTLSPRLNNLPPPALKLPGAAPRLEREAWIQSRPARPFLRALSPSPESGRRGGERTGVVPAPTWLLRPSPPSCQLLGAVASPPGAVVLSGWQGRKVRAGSGAQGRGAAAGLSTGPVAGPAAAGE